MSHRVIRHTVSRLVIALAPWALAACATGPSLDTPAEQPGGWIYFSPAEALYTPPARVDVRTGAIESLAFPSPFEAQPYYYFHERLVSPTDGDLTGDAKLGGLFPETFVLDAASARVTIYRDVGGSFNVALDRQHAWAPDGSAITFRRDQAQGCCSEWVVLRPAQARLDTLAPFVEQVPSDFTWFGPDTLLWLGAQGYRTYALATGDTAAWSLVPYYPYKMPTVSGDRMWVAHWETSDSLVIGEGEVEFNRLRLFDRHRGLDTVLVVAHNYNPDVLLSESFDPGSRFLAYCSSLNTIRILRLATGTVVKELPVPFCWSLNWSWGPEGRPPDLGG